MLRWHWAAEARAQHHRNDGISSCRQYLPSDELKVRSKSTKRRTVYVQFALYFFFKETPKPNSCLKPRQDEEWISSCLSPVSSSKPIQKGLGGESSWLSQGAGWVFSCYCQRERTCKFCSSLSFIISDDLAANAKNKFSCFLFKVDVVHCFKKTQNYIPERILQICQNPNWTLWRGTISLPNVVFYIQLWLYKLLACE